MRQMACKTVVAVASFAAAVVAFAADFTISNVQIRQRWPWEHKVDIDFDLDCDDGSAADVAVRLYDGDTELTGAAAALSGDRFGIARGSHRIVFEPTNTVYVGQTFMRFRAELSATESPLYMIVDLDKAPGEAGQKTYVTQSDLEAGLYGACVTNPIAGVSSLIWTDVTNDVYKTSKLVFRRINAGSFTSGWCGYSISSSSWIVPSYFASTNTVMVSQPFYIGVFELTQAQAVKMGGSNVSRFKTDGDMRPVEFTRYYEFRGQTPDINWPQTGYAVGAGSQIEKYRTATGINTIDMPTDAQWEYACRAGTTTYLSDGVTRTIDTILANAGSTAISAALNSLSADTLSLGRFIDNTATKNYNTINNSAGSQGPTNGTAIVGSYAPNAWGLYDMHGNVLEWCLDWAPPANTDVLTYGGVNYDISLQCARFDATDPAGYASGTLRIAHGGAWAWNGTKSGSGYRTNSYADSVQQSMVGIRLVCYPEGVTPVVGWITPSGE